MDHLIKEAWVCMPDYQKQIITKLQQIWSDFFIKKGITLFVLIHSCWLMCASYMIHKRKYFINSNQHFNVYIFSQDYVFPTPKNRTQPTTISFFQVSGALILSSIIIEIIISCFTKCYNLLLNNNTSMIIYILHIF